MKVNKTIFGSGPEKRLFKSLESAWPSLRVYLSLPFAVIVDLSGARLREPERQYLLKTSVDYTVCSRLGRPFLSVEFDGLGHGYSHPSGYHELVQTNRDPNRAWKMSLKLRVAQEVRYPLFVVSYDEAAPIDGNDKLTVAHAIVGRVMAAKFLRQAVETQIAADQPWLDELPDTERGEWIQDALMVAEGQLSLEWDPLARARAEAEYRAWESSQESSTYSLPLWDPPLPEGDPLQDLDVLQGRIDGMKKAHRVGAMFVIESPDRARVVQTAWVRNISGVDASGIADDLASILACRKFAGDADGHV